MQRRLQIRLSRSNTFFQEIVLQKLFTSKERPPCKGRPFSSTANHGAVLCQRDSDSSDAGGSEGAYWLGSKGGRLSSLNASSLSYARPGPLTHGLSLDSLRASRAGGARVLALGHGRRALETAGAINIAAPGLKALLQLSNRCRCCGPLLSRQLTADHQAKVTAR